MNDLASFITENLHNENVEIAYVNKSDDNKATKLSKNEFIQKSKINNRMKEISQNLSELTWHERFEWVHQKKLKGNRLIKKNKLEEAINTYIEATMGLDLQNGNTEEKERVRNDLQIPLIMNLASCFLKKKEYLTSIKLYTSGIKINCTYYKLFMKRGFAYKCMKEFEKAKDDYVIAKKLANDDSERQEVKEGFEDMKQTKEKEFKTLKKYFEGNSNSENNSEKIKQTNGDLNEYEQDDEEEILKYNDEWEEMAKFKIFRWILYPTKKSYSFLKLRVFNCCRREQPKQFSRNMLESIYSKGGDYLYSFMGTEEN